jgi:RNA polymerase sigma-70 factor, ECF subfamily
MAEEIFDKAWLQRVRENDPEASHTLVRELFPQVMKIVRGHLPRRMDAEDLAQIVFVKIFQKIDQYHGDAPFPHWVSRIAVNTCLNELRAEKARPELRWADLGEEQAEALQRVLDRDTGPTIEHDVATRDLADRLLETLPARDRLILTLLDLEERSVAEVSAMTGSPEAVVKVRAFRARRKLRKEFERLEKQK